MKLSNEIIQQIPVLFRELGNKKAVAEKLSISVSSVSKYLALYEATPDEVFEKKKRKKRAKIDEEMIEKINILFEKAQSLTYVAKQVGYTPAIIRKHLTEENLKLLEKQNDDRDALFFYILKLFGCYTEEEPVKQWNIIQMMKFREQGMSFKGQLLALKYFYEVKKGSVKKSNGSIGIIPSIWNESELYYKKEAKKVAAFDEAIQRQLEQDRITIKYNPNDYMRRRNKHRKIIDLDKIGEDN